MAKLGKGILGAPTGVIGNVMCYNRLGKSIIQSRSHPVDSYKRYWNLLRSRLLFNLGVLWPLIPFGFRNQWALDAPVGVSGEDYFYSYNLLRLRSFEARSIEQSLIFSLKTRNPFLFSTYGKWGDSKVYLDVSRDALLWSKAGDLVVYMSISNPSGVSITVSHNFGNINYQVLELPISSSHYSGRVAMWLRVDRVSPSYLGKIYATNILNPSYFDL